MKAAFLYINAGKGHYIPAKALTDSFKRAGYDAVCDNLFTVFGAEFWDKMAQKGWQYYLHHYKVEPYLTRLYDNRHVVGNLISHLTLRDKNLDPFKMWLDREKPDFILITNLVGAPVVPVALKEVGYDCPCYLYAADVFDTPNLGVSNKLDAMYIPSDIGRAQAIKRGMEPERVRVCPFPLQEKMEYHEIPTPSQKENAKKKLGLENRFTILISFGGEGVGDAKLLERLSRIKDLDSFQVVIVGGKNQKTDEKLDAFQSAHPDFNLIRPGFVNNMNEYLAATDLQVGKAGANSVMESLYYHIPCIVSQLLYPFGKSKDYLEKYHVGWAENSIKKQAKLIEKAILDENFLSNMEKNFSSIPIVFSSDKMRDMLIEDYLKDKELARL